MSVARPVVLSLLALTLAACAGQPYGPPEAPTAAQQQASNALLTSARTLERASRGAGTAAEWLEVSTTVAQLSELALVRPQPATLETAQLDSLDLSCARGSAQQGFVFDDCQTGSGALRGQVKVEAPGVRLELSLPSAAPRTTVRLEGPVTVSSGRVSGRIAFTVGSEPLDQGNGVTLQEGGPGLQTFVDYDLRLDGPTPEGTAEVRVSTRGGQDEALFTWADDTVTVRNSADAR